MRGEVAALRESIAAAGRWTLLCLSSGVGEAVERGGWAGGGLDAAVEPSGEDALEAAADVAVGLALGGAFGFVGPGFFVAAQRVIATVCRARLRLRSPVRLSRCRVRWPLLASSGATPAREANAASLRTRPRWDQLTRSWAATTGPTPGSASSVGPAGCCG